MKQENNLFLKGEMTMEKKITKKDVLMAVRKAVENYDIDFGGMVTATDVINYIDTTVAQMNAKNEKAKERAAKKKADSDVLVQAIADVLTDDYQTIDEIVAALDTDDVTNAKVANRASKLAKDGIAEKGTIKLDGGRKVVGYKKA
jgi:hypothetical protein